MDLFAWLLSCMALVQVPHPDAAEHASDHLRAEYANLQREETAQLQDLAEQLEGPSASAVRRWIEPEPSLDGPSRFVLLPELEAGNAQSGLANVPPDAPESEAQAIRSATAERWFEMAEQALEARKFALADDCLRRVVDREPDHAEARRLLGFVPHEGGWATPYAVEMLRKGNVRHETFGWVPESWVPHLDEGKLPAPFEQGRRGPVWMDADEADALRQRDFSRAWEISTPHFQIRANVPLAVGIDFGRRLEDFHQAFVAIMGDVIGPERLPLAARHRRPDAAKPAEFQRKHRVNYFATKQEYVETLRPWEGPKIEQSLGIYIPPDVARRRGEPDGTSYFFNDEGGEIEVTATLYHEVSHQLLFELAGRSDYERNVGNFWVFEGLGTYFETVRPQPDGALLIGGMVGPRIASAQDRIIEQDEYVPIRSLVAFDRNRFNADHVLYLHYAEAMALTVFLMDHDHGWYREPFLEYVADAYRGRLRAGSSRSLSSRLGLSYDELDQRFRAFLERAEVY